MAKNFGLGRGLGSLIPQNAKSVDGEVISDKERIFWVAPEEIEANPYQPRRDFREEDLKDLVNSIREHGILQPLVVSKKSDNKYELIAGERRLRASEILGLNKIPVILREANDKDKLVLALIENIQRSDLNPIEEGRAYKQLTEEFHFTLSDISKKTGKSVPVISNVTRLLNLPEEIQKGLIDKKITYTDARVILSLPTPERQIEFYRMKLNDEKMVGNGVVREVRKFGGNTRKAKRDLQVENYEEKLRGFLNTRVEVDKRGQSGKITIYYYAAEDLPVLVRKIIDKEET